MLTNEQIATYIEAFYNVDADNDDFISKEELEILLETTQTKATPQFLQTIFADLQINMMRISKKEVLMVSLIDLINFLRKLSNSSMTILCRL